MKCEVGSYHGLASVVESVEKLFLVKVVCNFIYLGLNEDVQMR